MAGIYIHIPFCKQRCTYCDFYTEVAPKQLPKVVTTIANEIVIRKDYLSQQTISTIYFGGGTPSLLSTNQFSEIFDTIFANFNVEKDAEITFEANPDDLTTDFLTGIKSLPFNRVSIGIQSFNDEDLKRINRRHTAKEAIDAVKKVQNHGISNVSIDLIYGLPLQSLDMWEKQVDTALQLNVQHISAYGLTYEEGTQLWKQLKKKKVTMVEDEIMIQMYELLLDKLQKNGFEAYEISNFSLPSFQSRHNSSYWKFDWYLGVGPSAHSFNGSTRRWNVASMKKYVNNIYENTSYYEEELLTLNEKYNDYVMVALRTFEGADIEHINSYFGIDFKKYFLKIIENFITSNHIVINNNKFKLTIKGIQISNLIIMELMKV